QSNSSSIAGKSTTSTHGHVYGIRLDSATTKVRFNTQVEDGTITNNSQLSNKELPLNQWSHVVTTYDGSEKRIYINGDLDIATAVTGTLGTGGDVTIGALAADRDNTDRRFDGLIDDVRVYSRALSADDIKALYLNSKRYC